MILPSCVVIVCAALGFYGAAAEPDSWQAPEHLMEWPFIASMQCTPISPVDPGAALEVRFAATAPMARECLSRGYCPVECSYGSESVVDALQMDHHAALSGLEGVAVRAYRDHFGARREDPRFVVTGAADADATFCIASLAGLLPHPSRAVESGTPPSAAYDFLPLAELINQADLAPVGLRVEAHSEGGRLMLFRQMHFPAQDALNFYAGVDRWRLLCGPTTSKHLLQATLQVEAQRVTQARAAGHEVISDSVGLVKSPVWGFDVWYAEVKPVIVAYVPDAARVTVGVRDIEVAERLFGHGGLKRVFPRLAPAGWGGRETVGGSPRAVRLTLDETRQAAMEIARCVRATENACPTGS